MTDQPLDAEHIESVEPGADGRVWTRTASSIAPSCSTRPTPRRPRRACVRCGISAAYPDCASMGTGSCSLCARYAAHRSRCTPTSVTRGRLAPRLREAARGRGSDYDCLLFSGGKDSTYVPTSSWDWVCG